MELDPRTQYWLAGLLEGEGTFCAAALSAPNQPFISVAMTDEDVIERVALLFGVTYHRIPARSDRAKDSYLVILRGSRAAAFMMELRPLMGERRRQQIDRALASYEYHPQNQGERNPKSKLTEAEVREIKRRLADGVLPRAICLEYVVSYHTITDIKLGRTWKHVIDLE